MIFASSGFMFWGFLSQASQVEASFQNESLARWSENRSWSNGMKTKGENYKLELRIINSEKLENCEYKDFGLHIKKIKYSTLKSLRKQVYPHTSKVSCRYFIFFTGKKNHNITSLSLKSPTIQRKALIKSIRSQK